MTSTHPFAVGDTFSHLTVEALVGRKQAVLRCACGETVHARASELLGGRIKSCGCQQYLDRPRPIKNLSGLKFGQWTVRERIETDLGEPTRWRVLCSCGKTGEASTDALTSGRSRRCRSCAGRAAGRTRTRAGEKRARRRV